MSLPDAAAVVSEISGDRPIESASEDRLGFKPLADRLAAALVDQTSSDGLVVGLEGSWGSGKSSLVNLIVKALAVLPQATRPVVVEFKPWLIGDRDGLLRSFFSQMASEIETVELQSGSSTMGDQRERTELVDRLREYSASVEVFGSILSAIPGAGALGGVIKQIGAVGSRDRKEIPLPKQKQRIDEALGELPRRILVTIDDVDRLEPREVIEILRLVRAVADFKNVVYLLCYDGEILARGIETAVQVNNGHSYLEKIVQVGVAVPIPEPFQLRRWFEGELDKFSWNLGDEDSDRLRRVVDLEGGRRLTTPRHVVRVLNTLRLLVPALRNEVDFADLVWLQLIRIGNHEFYRWVEIYCAAAAAVSSGRVSIRSEVRQREFGQLEKLLSTDDLTFEYCRFELSDCLPGIIPAIFRENDECPIYKNVGPHELEMAIRGRRLASPDHYRLYFALALPSSAPSTQDFDDLFVASSSSVSAVADILRTWMRLTDPAIGSKADLMLDRLQQGAAAALSPEQSERMVLGLADVMDDAAKTSPVGDLGTPDVWRQAERALPSLLRRIGDDRRLEVISAAFTEGRALGWLTSLLRHEIFGHGRYGRSQRVDESDWLLSDPELDRVVQRMATRYASMTLEDFASLPNSLSALFAWNQSGHEEDARAFIGEAAKTDIGLIRSLEMMANLIRSTSGSYSALKQENVSPFLDYDVARERLKNLSRKAGAKLKPRVETLLRYFESAESL